MKRIIAAVHGILTGQTDPSWPDKLDAWMYRHDPEVKVVKKEYDAGPFPHWNCRVKNPRLARSLANELELLEVNRTNPRLAEVWFVAHSNGALVALEAARILVSRGHTVAGLIFTGAACEGDVTRSGLLEWARAGRLHRAIAYCSRKDAVLGGPVRPFEKLWSLLIRPYGRLGCTGWLCNETPITPGHLWFDHFQTRWSNGGHSSWFAADQIEHTFAQFYHDIMSLDPSNKNQTKGTVCLPKSQVLLPA